MSSSDHRPRTFDPAIPGMGPWGAVHTARPLGERVWQVIAADDEGLVIETGETYEIDPPLQPYGPVTDTGGRGLRWVPEGVGADVVRLYFSGWGRIDLGGPERERLARSIALRAPAEWLMTLGIRRRALPEAVRDPLLAGLTAAQPRSAPQEPSTGGSDLLSEGLTMWLTAEHALVPSAADRAELTAWAPQIVELAAVVGQTLGARRIPPRQGPVVLAAALYRAIDADGAFDIGQGLSVIDGATDQLRRMVRTNARIGAYLWLSRFAPSPPPGDVQPELFSVGDRAHHQRATPPVAVGEPGPWGLIEHAEQSADGIVSARTHHRRLLALSVECTLALPSAVVATGTVFGAAVWFTWEDAATIRLFHAADLGLDDADQDRIELELARHDERAWRRWRRWADSTDPQAIRGVFAAPLVPGPSVSPGRLDRGLLIVAAGEPMIVTTGPIRAAAAPDEPVVIEVQRRGARGPVALIIPPATPVDTARVDFDRIRIVGPSTDRHDDWTEVWELRGPNEYCAQVRLWRDDRSPRSVRPDPAIDLTARILVEHLRDTGVVDRPIRGPRQHPVADPSGPVFVYRGAAGVEPWRRPAGPG